MAWLGDFGLSNRYRTWAIVLLAVVVAGLGVFVVFLGRMGGWPWEWSAEQKSFAESADFSLWLLLILAQLAAAPIVVYVVTEKIGEIRAYYHGRWAGIVGLTIVFAALALVISITGALKPDLPEWLPGWQAKIIAISVIVIAVALSAAVGIWTVQGALRHLAREAGDNPQKAHLDRLLHLQQALKLFLLILGTMLTMAVIAAAAQRKAVEAYGQIGMPKYKIDTDFPMEYVTMYGLLFSLLVALVYAPAHLTYLAVARRFRDEVVPLEAVPAAPDKDQWDKWEARLAQRKNFDGLFELQATTGANLKASIVTLAPLLASLTGLLD